MQLKKLELLTRFRGLQPGFTIDFSRPSVNVNTVEPLCLVGLNGSGKSNLMQVLAEIFNYLELFVLPEASNYFDKSRPFGFRIEYKLPVTPRNFIEGVDNSSSLSSITWRHILINKEAKKEPEFTYWYNEENKIVALPEIAGKLLPNQVFGYSSGMNELISTPFVKMDFYYLEMMRKKMKAQDNSLVEPVEQSESPSDPSAGFTVNRLYYLDYHSNAMVILANFLSETREQGKNSELDIINTIVGIEDLVSFRISINFMIKNEMTISQLLQRSEESTDLNIRLELLKEVEIPPSIATDINALMDCATTLRIVRQPGNESSTADSNKKIRAEMYFKVDDEMKRAFRDKFRGNATQLFRRFYLLNQLNIDTHASDIQEQIKTRSRETNVKAILTKVADEEKVFHIDSMRLKKKNNATVYYSQLSDGEHQYIQVAGALKLMDENGSLFLIDEPETHLNPEWRSTLFSTLNNVLKTRIANDPDSFVPQQEIIVTSHSPFIVSDCQSHQVFIFQRDPQTGEVKQPWHPDFNTYGASATLLTAKVYGKTETIAGLATSQMKKIRSDVHEGAKTKQQALDEVSSLGDSVEKVLLLDELLKLK